MPPATTLTLKGYYHSGLSPGEAYARFREDGGHQRKQDFLSAYRVVTQQPKAAYNVGGAARAGVKKPKVEKYRKKAEKIKAKQPARKPAQKKKRSASHGKKHKEGGETPPEKTDSAKRRGVDVSAHFGAGAPDLVALKKDLQAHGIKFFRRGGKDALTLATDGENGTVNLYGTMIYEPKNDMGGRVTGVARTLIRSAMKKIGRQTTL